MKKNKVIFITILLIIITLVSFNYKTSDVFAIKTHRLDATTSSDEYQIEQINQKFYRAKYEKTNLPKQGWIINIAVKNYEDYRRLLLNIIPELHKMQACYKITSPKMYSGGLEDVISIYLTSEFNFRDFSIKVQSILLENVNTQKNRFLMGRISAIFQNFFSTRFIDSTGRIIDSIASVTNNMLKNMSPFDILNYHETILEKYNESKNIVTYMQEYITGFPILSKKENYIFYNMYVIDNNYIDIIKEFKIYKENIDVNAIYEFTEYKNNKTPYSFVCVVVHKDFNEEMIREMIRNSIPYYQIKPTTTEDLS
jgi:hypothetical protein